MAGDLAEQVIENHRGHSPVHVTGRALIRSAELNVAPGVAGLIVMVDHQRRGVTERDEGMNSEVARRALTPPGARRGSR